MKTIWKIELTGHSTVVQMPVGAEILHVGHQGGDELFVWALVDPTKPNGDRLLEAVGTGHWTAYRAAEHHGTVVMPSGMVWHIFEAFPPA